MKHGLHIKKGDMSMFLKERINGKPSSAKSKAILLSICLLMLDVILSLTEEYWLILDDEVIEDSQKLAKLIF